MHCIEISSANFNTYLNELIEMADAFLIQLKIERNRTWKEKVVVLRHMVEVEPATHILMIVDGESTALAMCYFNVGSGYSTGGSYLWLNGIYVRPEVRRMGVGTYLLNAIASWSRNRGVRQILSSRDQGNEASMKLFASNGYHQSENVWLSKSIDVE